MRVEQTPHDRDDLTARLEALREVSSTIPLAPAGRVRARGAARRRNRALATATTGALTLAAVVFVAAGLPGRPHAVAPPATRTPTVSVTDAAVITEPEGDPTLIVPNGQIDPVYFLGGGPWLKALHSDPISWHVPFDWEGEVATHLCDTDTRPTGAVGMVGFGTWADGEPPGEGDSSGYHVGWQKVRDAGDEAAAAALFEKARTAMTTCPDRLAADDTVTRDVTVEDHPEWDDTADPTDRPLAVYRIEQTFDAADPYVEWVAFGYASNGLFTVITTTADDDRGETVASLCRQALDRLAATVS